jgi:anti-sigma B factor antagonist
MPSAEFQPLTIVVEQAAQATVLTATGEIDTMTAPDLQASVEEALPPAGAVLVLDLTGVSFLSSAGLSVLVSAHQQAEDAGGQVRIVVDGSISRVFDLTGLSGTLRLHDSLDEALA